jgi:hypothetical protein
MDPDVAMSNVDYYKRGYPADWNDGWTDAIGGFPHEPRGYEPAYEDGYRRGLEDRNTNTTKERNDMADVDLDALTADMDKDESEAKAEAQQTRTTSAGGFDILAGIDDDLDKGSGRAWIPEKPGDQLVGMIEGVDEVANEYTKHPSGRVVLLLIRERETGDLYNVRGFGTVLDNRLRDIDAHVGDGIGIRFLGKEQPANASYQPYNNFTVKLIRAS